MAPIICVSCLGGSRYAELASPCYVPDHRDWNFTLPFLALVSGQRNRIFGDLSQPQCAILTQGSGLRPDRLSGPQSMSTAAQVEINDAHVDMQNQDSADAGGEGALNLI